MSICLDLRASYKQPSEQTYTIDGKMFESMEKSIVKGGDFSVTVRVAAGPAGLNVGIKIKGTAVVECDRCLDDMELSIDCNKHLDIEFADHSEDTGDIVYVTQNQTQLDLWPIVYDYITLEVPINHTHAEGQCNKEMIDALKKYMVSDSPKDDDTDQF